MVVHAHFGLPPKQILIVLFFLSFLQPSLADFHNAFQVVFVDPSGHLNMCADMTACTYKQVYGVNKRAKTRLTVRLCHRFWQCMISFSAAAWGVCLYAVLGRPYSGRVSQPPHDPQTHDKDQRPCLSVCVPINQLKSNCIRSSLWTT